MPHRSYFTVYSVALVFAASVTTLAAEVPIPPSPFIAKYCIECHGEKKSESELNFERLGKQSPKDQTKVWRCAEVKLSSGEMPPEDAKQPTQEERQEFLQWITSKFGNSTDAIQRHWSFQPIVQPSVPSADAGTYAIDAFLLAQLDQHSLGYSPPADRRTLIRRVSLDLIGLPPSPEEVQSFLDDSAPMDAAFDRVVDRLLNSPHYGERWAQHWLDVIRWAETVGFETNAERRNAWPFRDWLIKSLNDDKPYDRFVLEQLAGDTVGEDAALGFLVAGPANLAAQVGRDEEAMRQARQDELDEVIRTVSQSLFGLTVGCARCHDHKFDPITARDYYSMQAIFAGLSYGDRRLRGEENDRWAASVPAAEDRLKDLQSALAKSRAQYGLRPSVTPVHTDTFASLVADAVRMEVLATESGVASLYEFEVWSVATDESSSKNVALASVGGKPSASSFALANQTRHFDNLVDGSVDKRQAFPWVAAENGSAWIQIEFASPQNIDRVRWHSGTSMPASYTIQARDAKSGNWQVVANSQDRLPRATDLRKPQDVQLRGLTSDQVKKLFAIISQIRKAQSELDRLENGPQVYAASFHEPVEETWSLARGDPMQKLEVVGPMLPVFLAKATSIDQLMQPTCEADQRSFFSRHLTQHDHPLTARVMVNRLWQYHFGTGLVETSSDFGLMGSPPSHPELLDWLAAEFIDSKWSIKQMHRLMVNTKAYQQSSRPSESALAVDAQSRLLWRYPPRRLDAEAIRDSILSVSGKLNSTMYGRGFDFFKQRGGLSDYNAKETFDENGWRRMIYAHKIRMQSIDIFGAFDCPDSGQMTPRRNVSITPLQSLSLFNSPFTLEQATFFAERIQTEFPDKLNRQIDYAFELAYSRPSSAEELQTMRKLAASHGLEQVCRVILNSSEFVFAQ